jgi:hypothetical protein
LVGVSILFLFQKYASVLFWIFFYFLIENNRKKLSTDIFYWNIIAARVIIKSITVSFLGAFDKPLICLSITVMAAVEEVLKTSYWNIIAARVIRALEYGGRICWLKIITLRTKNNK